MTKRRLIKRQQRSFWGGKVFIRYYSDGSIRVRCDHPSDDPGVEIAMAGATISILRNAMAGVGLDPTIGPLRWKSDPPTR